MRKVIFVRHAQALDRIIWEKEDISRPLTHKGKKHAQKLGNFLQMSHLTPDVIISSNAQRAKSTYEHFCTGCAGGKHHYMIEERLYTLPLGKLPHHIYMDILSSLSDKYHTAMIIAHNPDISDVVNYFSHKSEHMMRKGACAIFEFSVESWKEFTHPQKNSDMILGNSRFIHYSEPHFYVNFF